MKVRWFARLLVVCVIAVAFEFLFFNFSYLRTYLFNDTEHNVVIAGEGLVFVNWERAGDSYVSLADPQIIWENVNRYVRSFQMAFESAPVTGVMVFYTDDANPYFTAEAMIFKPETFEGSLTVALNRLINDLRIDLGDDPGLVLSDVKIILNPRVLDFSLSRIVAIVLVYLVVKFLFSLQKIPTYHSEVKSDAN